MGAAAGSVAMADELLAGVGGETAVLGVAELREAIKTTLDKLGPRERVLIIPPVGAADSSTPSRANAAAAVAERGAAPVRAQDFTRAHSQAAAPGCARYGRLETQRTSIPSTCARPHRLVPIPPAQRCWLLEAPSVRPQPCRPRARSAGPRLRGAGHARLLGSLTQRGVRHVEDALAINVVEPVHQFRDVVLARHLRQVSVVEADALDLLLRDVPRAVRHGESVLRRPVDEMRRGAQVVAQVVVLLNRL